MIYRTQRTLRCTSMSWINTLAHYSSGWINTVKFADALIIRKLPSSIIGEGRGSGLDSSILIFMSDHGSAYGKYRLTLPGFYEDKLHNMWIRLPPWIKKKFPGWEQALSENSR